MACPQVITGDQFLVRAIEHIDCQARVLGSYGYAALGEPGSLAVSVITALLTLFVALYALRLLFGPLPGARDTVLSVATIGIVLTLAFSWPAFRTLLYDTVLDGPAELAAALTAPELAGSSNASFVARLQGADDALVALTARGTGRQTGAFIGQGPQATFTGTAVEDESGFGWARVLWLGSTMGTLLTLRVLAGLLLALAPLAAATLLFAATRGLFSGWLRGLVLTLLGTTAVGLLLAVELAVLEPYLTDALRVRGLGYATPAVPTELVSLALAFALAKVGLVALLARVAWHRGWLSLPTWPEEQRSTATERPVAAPASSAQVIELAPRAARVVTAVENRMRFEEGASYSRNQYRLGGAGGVASGGSPGSAGTLPSGLPAGERLGQGGRRVAPRASQSAARRDSGPGRP